MTTNVITFVYRRRHDEGVFAGEGEGEGDGDGDNNGAGRTGDPTCRLPKVCVGIGGFQWRHA
jgi:hypothetical protein